MRIPSFVTAAGLTALVLAGPVAAQAPAMVKVADDTMVTGLNITADALEGMAIHDAAGKKIGEVEDVVGTDRTAATGVAIEFDRASGLGRETRVVALRDLKQDGLRLSVDLDAAAAEKLPVFDD
ncbi:hypothetical protein [Rhizobium sp. CC-YZS058]|uniref:hypothetical protein n=1 Tax=Rhizobium sp. CC-YZS058 TaxID=3042153 RepID=UPI002B0524CA|nr:hypothetical protein [Rhizobium sp. CC-YZS058]MEA3533205.1 hypothetical protein [Rhizobium sp. CC-YZS058]